MKKITSSTVDYIRFLFSQGLSTRKVAQRAGVSNTTVQRYTSCMVGLKVEKLVGGRPRVLSERISTNLVRCFVNGELKTTTAATQRVQILTGKKPSRSTIARMLRDRGLKNYAKPKKPRLTALHKKNRLIFSKLMKKFSFENWKKVIFTDESKICIYGPDGCNRTWCHPGVNFLIIM